MHTNHVIGAWLLSDRYKRGHSVVWLPLPVSKANFYPRSGKDHCIGLGWNKRARCKGGRSKVLIAFNCASFLYEQNKHG